MIIDEKLDKKFINGFAKSYVDGNFSEYTNQSERFMELKNIASSFELLGKEEWYPDLYFKHAMKSFQISLDTKFRQNFIQHVTDYAGDFIAKVRQKTPDISYVEIAKLLSKEKMFPVEKDRGYDIFDPLDYYISYLDKEFKKEYVHRDEICASKVSIIFLEELHKTQQYGSKIDGIPNIPLKYKDGTSTLEYFSYMVGENNIGMRWNNNLQSSTFIDGNENLDLPKGLSIFKKIPLNDKVIERMMKSYISLTSESEDAVAMRTMKTLISPKVNISSKRIPQSGNTPKKMF